MPWTHPVDSKEVLIGPNDSLRISPAIEHILGRRGRYRSIAFQIVQKFLTRIGEHSLDLRRRLSTIETETAKGLAALVTDLLDNRPNELIYGEDFVRDLSRLMVVQQGSQVKFNERRPSHFGPEHSSHLLFEEMLLEFSVEQSLARFEKNVIVMLYRSRKRRSSIHVDTKVLCYGIGPPSCWRFCR